MKVFVLRFYKGFMDDYDDEIVGIYSSEQLAKQKAQIYENDDRFLDWDWEIDDYKIDEDVR